MRNSSSLAISSTETHTASVSDFQFGGEFVWHPSPELIAQSNLTRFMHENEVGSFPELMHKSTTDIAWFWESVLRDLGIEFYQPYSRIVDLSAGKPTPRWCVDSQMTRRARQIGLRHPGVRRLRV